MKNLSGILLGITTLVCAVGGVQVLGNLNDGTAPNSMLIPILAVLGLLTLGSGVRGYFKSRAAKQIMPLVTSLSLVIGALAALMALYFLLP
ncbi:MAG: hypothetical protein EX271_03255 [Acidimicrobiales bacterium]|nr:hypothetical protein [Hyphomonadaceae bacterium]RZV43760.1 MAG: hypothetical protein EX271_03255 [Acidimicrobiales bacterium]